MPEPYPYNSYAFSETSKRAIQASIDLSKDLKDESVATGHLIYGLAKDPSVCLHHIFKDLNVDPDMFSGYVKSLPREAEGFRDTVFNRHVFTVFERAQQTSKHLGAKIIEPEHIALALMSVKAGSCYETLKEFSIDPDYVRLLIMEALGLEVEDAPEVALVNFVEGTLLAGSNAVNEYFVRNGAHAIRLASSAIRMASSPTRMT